MRASIEAEKNRKKAELDAMKASAPKMDAAPEPANGEPPRDPQDYLSNVKKLKEKLGCSLAAAMDAYDREHGREEHRAYVEDATRRLQADPRYRAHN